MMSSNSDSDADGVNDMVLSLGDSIYGVLITWKEFLLSVGRDVQLVYTALDEKAGRVRDSADDEFEIEYPVGLQPNGQVLHGTGIYSKSDLFGEYDRIAGYALPLNGIFNLVLGMEAAFEDVTKEILLRYPGKLSSEKKILTKVVFESESVDEIRSAIVSDLLLELGYNSPRVLAETLSKIYSFNLLEIPQYSRYIEIKASRDIHVHSRGAANEIYIRKADSFARVELGQWLPVTQQYFLESYEHCLKLLEVLERRFDQVWPSDQRRSEQESSAD